MSLLPRPDEANERQLRGFSLLLPFASALVVWLVRRHGGVDLVDWWPLAKALLVLLVVWAGVGVVSPGIIRPLYLVLGWAAWPIGIVLSTVIVALIFFAIVTPIGLALRLRGRDALRLGKDPSRTTMWVPRSTGQGGRYSRMF